MSDPDQGEYDLVDEPEPSPPPDETRPTPKPAPGQPLPRLWQTEDDEPQEAPSRGRKLAKPAASGKKAEPKPEAAPPRARRGDAAAKSAKASTTADGEKKVLREETPALDTYEARQKARFAVGGLIVCCVGLLGWVFYQLFLSNPTSIDFNPDEPPAAEVSTARREACSSGPGITPNETVRKRRSPSWSR